MYLDLVAIPNRYMYAFGHSIITSFDLRRRAVSGYQSNSERETNVECAVRRLNITPYSLYLLLGG